MASLAEYSTKDLAAALLERSDCLDAQGVLPFELYKLLRKMVPILCADAVPLRRKKRRIEAMAIVRGFGPEKGKFLSIGGRLRRMPDGCPFESLENSLRRQVRTDVGCEIRFLTPWDQPVTIAQYAPPINGALLENFNREFDAHLVSLFYPVELIGEPTKFGSTAHGGQEATGVLWFTKETMPAAKSFGYSSHRQYLKIFEWAETNF